MIGIILAACTAFIGTGAMWGMVFLGVAFTLAAESAGIALTTAQSVWIGTVILALPVSAIAATKITEHYALPDQMPAVGRDMVPILVLAFALAMPGFSEGVGGIILAGITKPQLVTVASFLTVCGIIIYAAVTVSFSLIALNLLVEVPFRLSGAVLRVRAPVDFAALRMLVVILFMLIGSGVLYSYFSDALLGKILHG